MKPLPLLLRFARNDGELRSHSPSTLPLFPKKYIIRPLVLNDIHTCRKLVVREGTRIDVSVK